MDIATQVLALGERVAVLERRTQGLAETPSWAERPAPDGARLVELEARLVEQGAELDRLRSRLVEVTEQRDEAIVRSDELFNALRAFAVNTDRAERERDEALARAERAEGEGARCRATMADATAAAHRRGWDDCLAAVRRALDVHNYPGV